MSRQTKFKIIVCLIGTFWLTILGSTGCSSSLNALTVEIGNRMYPDFHDTVVTTMQADNQIGDTEYSFKAVEFYPHFAIVDSTKNIISLSDEPKNPAFKIRVYKDGDIVDENWAFFGPGAPHFSMKSMLWFRVMSFTYRDSVYR